MKLKNTMKGLVLTNGVVPVMRAMAEVMEEILPGAGEIGVHEEESSAPIGQWTCPDCGLEGQAPTDQVPMYCERCMFEPLEGKKRWVAVKWANQKEGA
ncbi:MAG: hypothetical protein ACE5D3_05560 [Candidatus Binatia bacterium]